MASNTCIFAGPEHKDLRVVDALPVLGTGKLDHVTMTGRAAEGTRAAPEEEDA